ncbi:Protein N-acetyltransferase, RimJ/RimL family [Frankineae bacterium MT45]|nr:Protein N-acetyltransferase, RimJ/RimL family [Frankineae bacterium MT45]
MPTLRTQRLVLRPFRETDEDAAMHFHSREDVVRYIPWTARSREEVREAIGKYIAAQTLEQDGDFLNFAVVESASLQRDSDGDSDGDSDSDGLGGELIGQVVLMLPHAEQRHGEIGYVFAPEVQGRGYATEACRAVLGWGFGEASLHRITAHIDARNTASAALAERLGMRREAHFVQNDWFKGEWTDELVYALLAHEWTTDLASTSAPRPAGPTS